MAFGKKKDKDRDDGDALRRGQPSSSGGRSWGRKKKDPGFEAGKFVGNLVAGVAEVVHEQKQKRQIALEEEEEAERRKQMRTPTRGTSGRGVASPRRGSSSNAPPSIQVPPRDGNTSPRGRSSSPRDKSGGNTSPRSRSPERSPRGVRTKFGGGVKEQIKDYAEKRSEKALEWALDRCGDKIKDGAKDEAMPKFVRRAIDGVIDNLMPDIKEEIVQSVIESVTLKRRRHHDPGEGNNSNPSCCPNPFGWLRAKLRYTVYPYDRSIWENLTSPVWWLITVISIFPLFGIQQVYFIFDLLFLRDMRDEFQLCDFIVSFKGLQFLTMGVFTTYMGVVKYIMCVHRDEVHSCDETGPGNAMFFYETAILFGTQILLVWFAFALLPFSQKKGGRLYKKLKAGEESDDRASRSKCCGGVSVYPNRGGRLRRWILYDTFCFSIVAALLLWKLLGDSDCALGGECFSQNEWQFRATIFWAKVIYATTSFPFVLFKIPIIFTVLTHAQPTGFTRDGTTVALMKKRAPKDTEV